MSGVGVALVGTSCSYIHFKKKKKKKQRTRYNKLTNIIKFNRFFTWDIRHSNRHFDRGSLFCLFKDTRIIFIDNGAQIQFTLCFAEDGRGLGYE